MGLCGSGSYHCSVLEVPFFVCGFFFSVAAELCILSSCWGWGRLLLSLFLVCLLSNLPGAPAVFCFVSGSWRPFWGSTPRCLRLADLLLRWGSRLGFGGFLLQISCYPTLVFYLVPAQLPLRCFPLGFCALAGCVGMSDSSLLVYSWGCAGRVCAVPLGFSPMCCALPQGLQRALLSLMQVHWGFSGHRVSVLLLPWCHGLGFSPSLLFLCICSACLQGWPGLYTLCQGAPVTVMSPWFGVWSPCSLSLTLGWVCFWPAASQAFVVRHDFGFVDA